MADDNIAAEQPQGQDGGDAGVPYQEYLERVPEQYRGEVQPVLDDWNRHVNGRFEQHADYRKQWEPYEQAGINQVPAEELQGWLQFRQAAMENPQAIAEWYQAYAQQNGLTAEQAQQQAEQTPAFVDPDIEQLLEQKLGPLSQQFQEIVQWREQQDQAARTKAAEEYIEQQIATLAEKHGDQFNREGVENFIPKYVDTDPQNAVARAFGDYQNMVKSIEQQLVASKLKQPSPAESGGGTAVEVDKPKDLREAGQMALAQLRGENRQ